MLQKQIEIQAMQNRMRDMQMGIDPLRYSEVMGSGVPVMSQTDIRMADQHSIAVGNDDIFFAPKDMSTDSRDLVNEMRVKMAKQNSMASNTDGIKMTSTHMQAGVRTGEMGSQAKTALVDAVSNTRKVATESQGVQSFKSGT